MKGRKMKASGGSAKKGVAPNTAKTIGPAGKRLAPLDGEVAHTRVDRILRVNGSGKPSNVAGNAYKASEGKGIRPKK
jgi:hypothetical protein